MIFEIITGAPAYNKHSKSLMVIDIEKNKPILWITQNSGTHTQIKILRYILSFVLNN